VLRQQNMHNKEAIACGFLGFLTPCSLPPRALYLPVPALFQADGYFSPAMQIFRRAACTEGGETKSIQIAASEA